MEIQTKPTKMQKIIKGKRRSGKGLRKKLADAQRRVVDYATINPGDSHRPGRTTEITND